MSYEHLARFYDRLMPDEFYEQWLELFLKEKNRWYPRAKKILDLACGTGEIAVRLAKLGLEVTGIDLSEPMLAIAEQKARMADIGISLFVQDMRCLEGLGPFDIAVCCCDSLNYLETEKDVSRTFASVHAALSAGGLFLFDVHSIEKMAGFIGKQYADNDDEISYIWTCYPGEAPHSVEHELTFFISRGPSGLYERWDEIHRQRTFPVETYIRLLEQAGFEVSGMTGDFTDRPPGKDTERIFFCARKRRQ